MPHLKRDDLQFDYQWSAIPPDDARLTGKPDDVLLNRREGYEVLAFLNAHAEIYRQEFRDAENEVVIRCHLPRHLARHIAGPEVTVRYLNGPTERNGH